MVLNLHIIVARSAIERQLDIIHADERLAGSGEHTRGSFLDHHRHADAAA